MFEVIKGSKKEKKNKDVNYVVAYGGSYIQSLSAYLRNGEKDDLYKLVYNGVMYAVKASQMATGKLKQDNELMQSLFESMEKVKNFIKLLTPNELMRIFPIKKIYDGKRWESKDYFFTMKALKEHGFDNPIGDEIEHILWDYMNSNISIFQVCLMSVISKLYRAKTGKDCFQEFCEQQGITTYAMTTDQKTGKKYLTNNDTGETYLINKPIPRHLKLLQGKNTYIN